MDIKALLHKIYKPIYDKIVKLNDSPHKISLGLAIGIFLGILPGTGPLAALVVATLLKVNPISAVLASVIVNTWTGLFTFLLSIRIGSAIMQLRWQDVYDQALLLVKDFHWDKLIHLSSKIILPIIIGHVIIGLILGLITYAAAFTLLSNGGLKWLNRSKGPKPNKTS